MAELSLLVADIPCLLAGTIALFSIVRTLDFVRGIRRHWKSWSSYGGDTPVWNGEHRATAWRCLFEAVADLLVLPVFLIVLLTGKRVGDEGTYRHSETPLCEN